MTFLDKINTMPRPDTHEEHDFRFYVKTTVEKIQEQYLWGKKVKKEISGYFFDGASSNSAYIGEIITTGTFQGSPVLSQFWNDNISHNEKLKKYDTIDEAQRDINGFRRILTELGFWNFTLRIDKVWLEYSIPQNYPWYDLRFWTETPRTPKARYLIYLHITW